MGPVYMYIVNISFIVRLIILEQTFTFGLIFVTNLLYDDVVSIKSYGCMLFILQSGRSVYESQSFKESV